MFDIYNLEPYDLVVIRKSQSNGYARKEEGYWKCCLHSGWPSISLQIWHYDEFGRQELYGYGSIFLPASPGEHQVLSSFLFVVVG